MTECGWTHHNASLLPADINLHPKLFTISQSPAKWKALVTNKCAQLLQACTQHLQSQKQPCLVNSSSFIPNDVKVIHKEHLTHSVRNTKWTKAIDFFSQAFELNDEQDCAYRIIVNHSCSDVPEQLKMYLGGMAGTGKTHVLQALSQFFSHKKEAHLFVVVAPTGSAAALFKA
jgi:chromosomal replication initiation ATPase DnaA